MLARKSIGSLFVAAAALALVLGTISPAQATTTPAASAGVITHSINRFAPTAVTTLPYCQSWIPLHPDSGAYEGRGMLPATSGGSPTCILATGNNSTGVTALQIDLSVCYGKTLAADGIFGTATYNALMAVQRQIGVTIDGIYGPGTRNKMYWYSGTGCHPITYYQGF